MMAKATEIEKSGKKLIRLDVGEPDFRPPKAVLDAVSNALYSYKTYYTVGRGIPELLTALQDATSPGATTTGRRPRTS